MAGISANRLELLQIAAAVAQEKNIDKAIVLGAIEEAIQKAARLRYGSELDIRAKLDPVTGSMDLTRVVTVVADDEIENDATQTNLVTAQLDHPDAEIGYEITTPLPPIEFGRVQSQMAKQVIMQKVREAERAVYEGIIQIVAVARDPGSRAKIAVYSNDGSIDPVGACVGMRGSRVQAVVNELQGERIDIIPWTEDAASFIVNALQPAEVTKVVLDQDENRIEVVVPDEQLSLAIGRRGQNVRLASQLSGWSIDIMTEEQESERRQKEFAERSELFMTGLDVDEMIAQLLVSEGFQNMEEVGYVELTELSSIEGFDEETAQELQERAREYLQKVADEQDAERKAAGVEDGVLEIEGVTLPMAVIFGKNEILTVEDVAGLVPDDIRGYTEYKNGEKVHEEGILESFKMTEEAATMLIMQARVKAGWIDAAALEEMEEAAEEEIAETEETGEAVLTAEDVFS